MENTEIKTEEKKNKNKKPKKHKKQPKISVFKQMQESFSPEEKE